MICLLVGKGEGYMPVDIDFQPTGENRYLF
jgi:hypothetical protein